MKLKNKISGEIKEFCLFDGNELQGGATLESLTEEWEDAPEEEYWWIDYDGKVKSFIDLYEWQDKMKEIGNYFCTKEEAEKAVKRLRAWKRLKDNGFRFEVYGYDRETVKNGRVNMIIRATFDEKYGDGSVKLSDLDLLFSGEDN